MEQNAEVLNDAIYLRNRKIEVDFDVKITASALSTNEKNSATITQSISVPARQLWIITAKSSVELAEEMPDDFAYFSARLLELREKFSCVRIFFRAGTTDSAVDDHF